MKIRNSILMTLAMAYTCLAAAAPQKKPATRPNVLLIVADDLGYSDIGAYGGEIATPNIDALAKRGLRMTDFYASMFCSPTRAMLMSGVDNHRSGFGNMGEFMTPEERKHPGYEGALNQRVVTFPELLRDAGYHTYMAGKWHLGMGPEHDPINRGFEQAFALLNGGAGHFDQTGIITKDVDKTPRAVYRENGKPFDLPEKFYSSEFFTDKIIASIDSNKHDGKPFLAYLAFTAPHWPLQAPDEYIRKYEGKYDAGYDVIREQRLARMKAIGIVAKDTTPYRGNEAWPGWDKLTPLQKKVESKRMAVYAAMVEAMDAQIGRVIAHLKQIGEYDNTVIFFMSDNGADGNSVFDLEANREWIKRNVNNSMENTGRKGSFIEYGPGWAQVSSTPFNMYKSFAFEGGIAVPQIVVLPDWARGGAITNVPAHVTDIAPTILALTGVAPSGMSYQGREVFPMTGHSMRSFLNGQSKSIHPDGFTAGWELMGRKALRKGDWKIVLANAPWGTGEWELYNVARDRSELNNLAKKNPAKLKEMLAEYDAYSKANGVLNTPAASNPKGYSNAGLYYQDINEQTK